MTVVGHSLTVPDSESSPRTTASRWLDNVSRHVPRMTNIVGATAVETHLELNVLPFAGDIDLITLLLLKEVETT